MLTCIVQSSGDNGCRPLRAVLRHTTVGLHSERVVEMRIQVTDDNCGVLQICRAWIEAYLVTARDAQHPVTVFAHHTVFEVTAAPGY